MVYLALTLLSYLFIASLVCLIFQAFIPSSSLKDDIKAFLPDRTNRIALVIFISCFTLLGVWVALG